MPIASRGNLHSAIHALLTSDEPNLSILGVSGPGGIGKTWSVRAALADFNLFEHGIIQIFIDGSDENALQRSTEFASQYLTPLQLPEPGRFQVDHFPHTRKILKAFRSVCIEAKEDQAFQNLLSQGHEFLLPILEAGVWLNDALPILSTKINLKALKKSEEAAFEAAMKIMKKYQESRSILPWKTVENNVKRDLLGTLSEAMAIDFKAMLIGFVPRDPEKYIWYAKRRIDGCNKLLIVIDDFEKTREALGDLLLNNLLGKLRDYHLPIRMIIAGRDSLFATDLRFEQYLAPNIVGQYALDVLPKEEAIPLLHRSGFTQEEAESIYSETGGYPYLIGHYLDQGKEGFTSALGAKMLYERTTKWMNPQQKQWLKIVLPLDSVSERSIRESGVTPGEEKVIYDWFQNEPSLRDPRASTFKVNSMLRTHIARYLELSEG